MRIVDSLHSSQTPLLSASTCSVCVSTISDESEGELDDEESEEELDDEESEEELDEEESEEELDEEESEEELDDEELDKEISTVTHELNAIKLPNKQHKNNFFFMEVSFYMRICILVHYNIFFALFQAVLQGIVKSVKNRGLRYVIL